MNIFFDLDGTLIDSRQRLYQLFQNLVPQSHLSFDDYWNLKRNKINHETILQNYFGFENKNIELFNKNWMRLIETNEYLDLDEPFEGVSEYLVNLKNREISICIITARQFRDSVSYQLDRFGWTNLFDKILVTEQHSNKEDLIKPFVDLAKTNWIIGDTGKDIQVGKYLGIKTAAVLSGFLSKESLLPYRPDIIIDKITNLKI